MPESSSKARIILGSGHAGFRAKQTVKNYLEGAGYRVNKISEMYRILDQHP